MKICVVTRNLSSDYIGNFEFDQAMALKQYGHDVYVLSIDMRSIRKKRQYGIIKEEYRGIKIVRCSFPISPLKGGLFYFVAGLVCKKALKELYKISNGFDIIHSHFLEISRITAGIIDTIDKTPFVVTEHSSTVNCKYEMLSKRIVKDANFVYKKADAVIAVSGALAKNIKDNFNINCFIVHNVYDEKIFVYEKEKRVVSNKRIIVSTGNLTKNKRMDLLIRAFAHAFSGDTDFELAIFGDGPEKGNLIDITKDLGIEAQVSFMGKQHRSTISNFYKNATLYVLLSQKETFGVSYIEAMASGLPIIGCFSGGPEDFINKEVGILVEASEKEISKTMKQMIERIDTYSGEVISNHAKKFCSSAVIADELTKVYINCCR